MDLIKLSIQSYAKFQVDCILCANGLIDKGIMDYHNFNNLPFLYTEFLHNSRESFLAFALTLKDIEQLRNLDKVFAEKCKTFASFNIAETLEHSNFHDNNIFTFFFICSFLYSVKHNYNLNNTDNNYKIMQNTYLNAWYSYGHYNELIDAFQFADNLKSFIFALSFLLIKFCPGIDAFLKYKSYLADGIRSLISNFRRKVRQIVLIYNYYW